MKKILSLLMTSVLVLALLALAGCGGNKKETSGQAESQQASGQKAGETTPAELFAKGKKIEGMSYDFTMNAMGVSMTGKYWLQGNKFKSEANMEGQRVITIFDGESFYTYNPDQNTAMKITPDKAKKSETPMDYIKDADSMPDRVKVVESLTYEGVPCKVIVVTGADGKEQSKMWVREDFGVPVRVEYTDASGNKAVMEYKNLNIGPQPPEIFKLPEGVQIHDLGRNDETNTPGSRGQTVVVFNITSVKPIKTTRMPVFDGSGGFIRTARPTIRYAGDLSPRLPCKLNVKNKLSFWFPIANCCHM